MNVNKADTTTTTMTAANTYTGATTVNAGTLQAGSTSAFGSNSAVTLANWAAKTGNLDQIKAAFGPVGGSCKACHDDFRKE